MECSDCSGTFQTWDIRIQSQPPDHIAARFPCLLTFKFPCDKCVVILMGSRHIGNSAASVMRMVEENHNEQNLKLQLQYMGNYKNYQNGLKELKLDTKACIPPPPMMMLASRKWLLSTYVRDVYYRKDGLTASTKTLANKLSGEASKSETWVANVGTESGHILISFSPSQNH